MPLRLDSQSADFPQRFRGLLAVKREAAEDVEQVVRGIVADVAARGDTALFALTAKFDRIALTKTNVRVTAAEIETAQKACRSEAVAALKLARDRIEAFHRRQMPTDDRFTDTLGVEMGAKWTAIESVGLYVPGGTAAYPSSVLMNAVPAKVAGVPRLAMVVPAPDGKLNPLVLAAAKLAGIDEIYRVGGAQAVAALAYGTESIAPVAKIVGPGNAYVAAAKRLVFGKVGIDMIAGPSEVLILADKTGNAEWIAADLLAQAEHDVSAQSILITDNADLAAQVEKAVELTAQDVIAGCSRETLVGKLWRHHRRTRACRRGFFGRSARARAPGNRCGRRRTACCSDSKCRRDFHRRSHSGSDRRLCCRLKSRAADGALGALLVGPRLA